MYTCTHISMYTCTYICTVYTCTHVHTYVHMYTCAHVYMCTCVQVYTVHMYVHVYMYTPYICMYMCTCIHRTYVCTCVHAYMCTCVPAVIGVVSFGIHRLCAAGGGESGPCHAPFHPSGCGHPCLDIHRPTTLHFICHQSSGRQQ